MRLLFTLLTLLLLVPAVHAQSVRSKGYVKKNGTYVAPSYRTRPDKSRANNWSSKGRVNPYTGKKGTVDPYRPKTRSKSTWRARRSTARLSSGSRKWR